MHPSSASQIPSLELEALFIIHRGRGVDFFQSSMKGISSATPTHCFEKLPCCTLGLHILCTNTEAHWVLHGVPREGAGWIHPQRRETGDVLFQLMLGPVGGLCVAEQTSSAGVSQEGICLGRFLAGEGSSGWNF